VFIFYAIYVEIYTHKFFKKEGFNLLKTRLGSFKNSPFKFSIGNIFLNEGGLLLKHDVFKKAKIECNGTIFDVWIKIQIRSYLIKNIDVIPSLESIKTKCNFFE
jgi:hypothetical protein